MNFTTYNVRRNLVHSQTLVSTKKPIEMTTLNFSEHKQVQEGGDVGKTSLGPKVTLILLPTDIICTQFQSEIPGEKCFALSLRHANVIIIFLDDTAQDLVYPFLEQIKLPNFNVFG